MALIPEATAGPYWVGDIPAPIAITYVDSDFQPVSLDGVVVTAALRVLGVHGTFALNVTQDGDTATVAFPSDASKLNIQGIYDIETRLTTAGTSQEAEPLGFVVQDHDGWLTLGGARRAWADSPDDDILLYGLLDSAKRACLVFAPDLPTDDDGDVILPLPAGYTQAQLLQARNTWNNTKTDPSLNGDDTMFVLRPYPLDNFIKQLLRPRGGTPVVG